MFEYDQTINANSYNYRKVHYQIRLKDLLYHLYKCYRNLIFDKVLVPQKENDIRDILVDNYFLKDIHEFTFKKETNNNLGRVDIYIIKNKTELDLKPHFIVECKLLNNININGKDGLNGKYITNGIQRFLTEHYYLNNNFNTNIMLGFIIEKLDIASNIDAINALSEKVFKNIVAIKQPIILDTSNIYKSAYQTGKPEKDFFVYHLMMDFSNNLIQSE